MLTRNTAATLSSWTMETYRVRPPRDQRIYSFAHRHALFFMAVVPVAVCYFCIVSSYLTNFEHVATLTQECHDAKLAKGEVVNGMSRLP